MFDEHLRYIERKEKRRKKRIDAMLAMYDLSRYRESTRRMLAMAHSQGELEDLTERLMDEAAYIYFDRPETLPPGDDWCGRNMTRFHGAKELVVMQEYFTRANEIKAEETV